jgi:hypothetical protein
VPISEYPELDSLQQLSLDVDTIKDSMRPTKLKSSKSKCSLYSFSMGYSYQRVNNDRPCFEKKNGNDAALGHCFALKG